MWPGEFGAPWAVVKHIKRAAKHLGTSKDVCSSYSGIALKKKKKKLFGTSLKNEKFPPGKRERAR